MDAAPVMIWVSREDKLCCWFNKSWLAFTGRKSLAMAGLKAFTLTIMSDACRST
jgi:hypothetical protein